MYCPQCGTQNLDNSNYCSVCGYKLKDNTITASEKNFNYAGFWLRFLASMIDNITIGIVVIPFVLSEFFQNIGLISGWFILNWLYFSLLESSPKQATVGKLALGIVVTDLKGNKISFARASARYWSKFVSTAIIGIGFIMAGFTSKKQALHDIIAETLVIKNR